MYRLFDYLSASLMIVLMLAPRAMGSNTFPLEPPDTSNPRATLESFLYYSNFLAQAMRESGNNSHDTQDALDKAIQCLDLSEIPPNIVGNVALESVLRLREILDRISLPNSIDIPDNNDVKKQNVVKWRIPHTELVIGKVSKGHRIDDFLFTPETVLQLDKFYEKVRLLPYKEGAAKGIYEKYIYSPGWMISPSLIKALPDWMKRGFIEQAGWQWIGLVMTIIVGFALLFVMLKWHGRLNKKETVSAWRLDLLIFPVSAIGLCSFFEYFIDKQINITGKVLSINIIGFEFIFYILSAWAILVGGNIVMHGIITSKNIGEDALDADVIRLVCRLISFIFVFVIFYRAGIYFGLPVTAIFTSAGIAGVAVALAARETLANFFGGISIFLDRPFRAGDYIILDNGERGEVKAVGMRSTRLLTRDDILITIPNSIVTNVKIVNQSMPQPHFRVRIQIGVAYGSNLEQVEKVLTTVAQNNKLLMDTPVPRVRLRSFGTSAINFELLVWAIRPHDQGLLTHELSKAIYDCFIEEGIEMPYPQLDIHIHPEKEGVSFIKSPCS